VKRLRIELQVLRLRWKVGVGRIVCWIEDAHDSVYYYEFVGEYGSPAIVTKVCTRCLKVDEVFDR
jgi:hypothetical protein